jgi:hypothetical protein
MQEKADTNVMENIKTNQAKRDINLKEMRDELKSGQAEMRSTVNAWIAGMKDDRREIMSCQVMMEACLDSKEPNLEDTESKVEHQEVPMDEAAVKSLGTMKTWHRGRHLAAG